MLVNLHVKNLALIEEADVNFENGLNILTGETGSGKSILIGSINVALGGKVNSDFIRKGTEYGLCELTFKIDSPRKIEALKALDVMELDDGEVIISRKIMPNRTTIKVNGETKTVSEVKEIASLLIDIHGQHEHQSLLYRKNYLDIIDRFGQDEILKVKSQLFDEYKKYTELKKKFEEFAMDDEELNRQIDYIQYELKEIKEADLKDNEDVELELSFKKFNNYKKIVENISEAYHVLSEDDESVSVLVSKAYKNISAANEHDELLNGIFAQIRDLEDLVNGLNSDISDYISGMEYDEETFAFVNERLSLINRLKQKYGNSIEEIRNYYNEKSSKLCELTNYDENKNKIYSQLCEAKKQILEYCEVLSDIRSKNASKLSKEIVDALKELNFLDVKFEIVITRTEHFNENGFDEIDFNISTNPGEELKPLSKVASGGELSRIMLAIKTVLADKDDIDALIFDEIDTGISGRTAQMVSVKLSEISRTHQVLCITHLPQIASMADEHFVIEKNAENGSTITTIKKLDNEESVIELARLLGGVSITENVIKNAREMKDLADRTKTSKNI